MDGEGYYGKYRGIVLKPKDESDAKAGRITVEVTLGGDTKEIVAEACVPAGIGTGLYYVPPERAGVWIEFVEGNIDDPIWTGGWWKKSDLDSSFGKAADLDNQPVILQSVHGQRIILDKDRIVIETSHGADGPSIVFGSDKSITVKSGSCSIEVSQQEVKINGENLKVLP
jgi:uncharacterized protein involved in type VI secretion and phage assembly